MTDRQHHIAISIAALLSMIMMFAATAAYAQQNCNANPSQPFCQGTPGPQGPQGIQGEVGPQGPAGPTGPQGLIGPQGEIGLTGPQGEQGVAGINGIDGKDGINGLNGRDFDMDQALAIGAALSMPVWLGETENFRISTGLGFSEGETAFGATGVIRMDKNWAGFLGAAVGAEGSAWAGKAGLSFGF